VGRKNGPGPPTPGGTVVSFLLSRWGRRTVTNILGWLGILRQPQGQEEEAVDKNEQNKPKVSPSGRVRCSPRWQASAPRPHMCRRT